MTESFDALKAAERPGWIDRRAPKAIRPYLKLARADKPIGVWLLLWPCLWSIALAGQGRLDLGLALLFTAGAFVMRAAGCTFNDIVDRKLDARVARTASRPLPSGEVGLFAAAAFLVLLLLAGLAILLQLDPFAILLGAASLPLIALYPFMKRVTYWPQAFLGLTFNWGALLGWAAARGGLEGAPLALYAASILWTLGYDTIYAHQDKEDDALIGVKSSALKLGPKTKPWLIAFYAGTLALLALAGGLAGMAWPYFAALPLAGAILAWQAVALRIDDAADCLAKFKANGWVGLIVFVGLLLSPLAA